MRLHHPRFAWIAMALTLALVLLILWAHSDLFPVVSSSPLSSCTFRQLTGWPCPGCGMTRSLYHISRGELAESLRYHALCPLILIGILSLTIGLWVSAFRCNPLSPFNNSLSFYRWMGGLLLLFLIYWGIRVGTGTSL